MMRSSDLLRSTLITLISALLADASRIGSQNIEPGLLKSSAAVSSSKNIQQPQDQTAEPSMTSIHQVWTSTSTGNLEELSPEMISKLRGDVPFLAAYATRPRLLNGAAVSLRPVPADNYGVGVQLQAPKPNQNLQVGASSQVAAPPVNPSQADKGSDILRLGNFNEFNVETSSSSRSEHTHRKKTSLKRKSAKQANRRKIYEAAKKLVATRVRGSARKGNRSRKSDRSALLRSQSKTNKLRRRVNEGNLKHHMNIIRHGRYYQEQTLVPRKDDSLEMNVLSSGEDHATTSGKTNESKDDGTKGGGGRSKTPFYRKSSPDVGTGEEPNLDAPQSGVDDDSDVYGPEITASPTLKRVGDDDVDEIEGDTVMVMPKSDGVDDDPEYPVDETPDDVGSDVSNMSARGGEDQSLNDPEIDEQRPKRVNREKPDQSIDNNSVAGAGIGATSGSGDSRLDHSPGVEFADENRNEDDKDVRDDAPRSDTERDEDDSRNLGREPSDGTSEHVKPNFTNYNREDGAKDKLNPADRTKDGSREMSMSDERTNDDDLDVDYRDDHDSANRSNSSAHRPGHSEQDKAVREDQVCDHDEHHHHHHGHDTIQWLKDAVAGEPGLDYPILSSVNTSTSFNCRDQRYPGYYADVEARCQVRNSSIDINQH